MEEEQKLSSIAKKIDELHRQYGINRMELGEIMVIASTTLLIMSVHGYYSFKSVSSDVKAAEDSLQTTLGMMETEGFQRGMEAIRDMGSTTLGQRIRPALQTFQQSTRSVNLTETAADKVERKKNLYQWLSLVGILGVVAGVIIIVME